MNWLREWTILGLVLAIFAVGGTGHAFAEDNFGGSTKEFLKNFKSEQNKAPAIIPGCLRSCAEAGRVCLQRWRDKFDIEIDNCPRTPQRAYEVCTEVAKDTVSARNNGCLTLRRQCNRSCVDLPL